MAVLKCKMCGGDLVMMPGSTVAECEYCGSMQTLPRVSDERLASFYERANDLRMSHEFDKAVEIYEKIIEENPTDADAYWSMVLCEYGVEYVEETKGGPRKPTINRAQLVSVFENANYRSAIKNADEAQKKLYEEEAARIDRILQRYLEISRKEPPYDVFICYKETDKDGGRTIDSVRAGEIYRELTQEGFKVFFAPVTLENKLGEDYEPYIFAAIHSAKVMVVIGTKPEYMNAVWVKNEWSRFLTLAKEDSKKTLIPVYGGMDPYDMPEAFRFKQSQDMGKLGFMLDLVRGIEKLVGKNAPAKAAQVAAPTAGPASGANVDTLLQRAAIFMDDRDWSSANIYCEKVLDIVPTNGKAYFYKLMIEAKVTAESMLKNYSAPLENLKNYKNAVRYADEATTAMLIEYNQGIKDRLAREEQERLEAERIENERRQRAEERWQKKKAINNAVTNASAHLKSLVLQKERLEEELQRSKGQTKNISKHKKKIVFFAIPMLFISLIIFSMAASDADVDAAIPLWIVQCILAILLAGARDKSKVKAFLLSFLSVGILCFFPALSALIGTAKLSAKSLKEEQVQFSEELTRLDREIDAARKSLSELNSKKEAMETNTEDD